MQTSSPGRGSRRRARIVVVFAIVLALLVVSVISPWWTLTFSGVSSPGSTSSVSTYLPGSFVISDSNGSTTTCAMSGGVSSRPSVTCPDLNSTAALYRSTFALVVVAAAAGAGVVGLTVGGGKSLATSYRRARIAGILAGLCVVLAVVAFASVALGQPGAFAADSGSAAGATPFGIFPSWCPHTPSDTFFGSCTSPPNEAIHWYPSIGWGAAVVASAIGAYGLWAVLRAMPHRPRSSGPVRSTGAAR